MSDSNFVIYIQRGDFPEPVGMQTHSHINTGSFQSVPSTCTIEGDIMKLVSPSKEERTAVGGMLSAFPICAHPYT